MDFTILYDHKHKQLDPSGTVAYSDVLYIPPGKTALLSLYNMINELKLVKDPVTNRTSLQGDSCVEVEKLSYGQVGDIGRRLSCSLHIDEHGKRVDIQGELRDLLAKRRVFHEPVYQCGCTWTLNPCNNFALIPVPGFYRLKLFDPHQFDTAYVEYALLSVADSMAIPDDFKLGSK